jgi:hypothetical protein
MKILRLYGVWAEIRTEDLPNISLERYLQISLFGYDTVYSGNILLMFRRNVLSHLQDGSVSQASN